MNKFYHLYSFFSSSQAKKINVRTNLVLSRNFLTEADGCSVFYAVRRRALLLVHRRWDAVVRFEYP